jgi:hypothetical protein
MLDFYLEKSGTNLIQEENLSRQATTKTHRNPKQARIKTNPNIGKSKLGIRIRIFWNIGYLAIWICFGFRFANFVLPIANLLGV